MLLRTAILALAITGMAQNAIAHPPGHDAEMVTGEEMPSEVTIPLNKVGGKWVAPFSVFSGGTLMQSGEFLVMEPFDADELPTDLEDIDFGGGEMPLGAEIFGSAPGGDGSDSEILDYVSTYMIIDLSAEFVVSLTEQAVDDLELTGADPVMVSSPSGFMTVVPIEELDVYDDEIALKAIATDSKKVLNGGEVLGALGKAFFDDFEAVLDQDAGTLTLQLPAPEGFGQEGGTQSH